MVWVITESDLYRPHMRGGANSGGRVRTSEKKNMRCGKSALGLLLGIAVGGACTQASATVFHPAPDPIKITTGSKKYPKITEYDWSATPGFTGSWYSNLSNVDVGNESPSH